MNTNAPSPRAARITMCHVTLLLVAGAVMTTWAPAQESSATLNVVGTIPLEGEIIRDQIVVFFDRDITLPVSADGTVPPVMTISPAVEGTSKVGRNYVAFKSEKFEWGNLYKIELNPAIKGKQGEALNPQHQSFAIANLVFEPLRVWTIEQTSERSVAGILFLVPMDVEAVRKYLSVKAPDGSDVPFEVEAGDEPQVIRVVFTKHPAWPVTMVLAEGLTDASGYLRLSSTRTYTYPVVNPLQVAEIGWNRFDAYGQEVFLRFSQPVEAEALKEHLSIQNADTGGTVSYELLSSGTDNPHIASLALNGPNGVRLTVTLSEGLAGGQDTKLMQTYTTTIERAAEALRIDDLWWMTSDRDGLVMCFGLNMSVDVTDLMQHLEFSPALPELRIERRYGSQYSVYGQWASKRTYEMRLKPGLRVGGAPLKEAVTRQVTSDQVPGYIGFGHEGKFYFPRQGGLALPLESRNVRKAKMTLHRLFPSNIAIALRDMEQNNGDTMPILQWCETLGSQEVSLQVDPDRIVETPLNLNALFPDKKGVFALQAETAIDEARQSSGEEGDSYEDYSYWRPAAKLVLMTDIGLLAHWRDQELVVFAHDLFSLKPLPLTKVSVYSDKNQLMGQGNTDEQGVAHLTNFDTSLGTPAVAIAEHGEDYTFLELEPRQDDQKAFEPDLPPYNAAGYDGFIYADRELYRPGEMIHLRWLVRKQYGEPLRNVPLLVSVVKPNGRNLLTKPTLLSSWGTAGMDLQTQKAFPTGLYTVKLSVPGSEAAIGSYSFHLEDFVPNRMKVALTAPEGVWSAGTDYSLGVNAQHLFGAAAVDRRAEALVTFSREPFKADQWPGFRFDNDSDFVPEKVSLGEAQTDEEGNATFTFNYTPPAEVTFPVKATVIGRVYELGGRAVVDTKPRFVLPAGVLLGVAMAPAADGKGVEVFAAAINADQSPASLSKVTITLEKQSWNYYVRRYYSHYESNWSDSFEPVESRVVDVVNGRASTVFAYGDYGYYRVRVSSEATPQYSTQSFYAYGDGYQSIEASRPSLIKVTLDKTEYQVGEDAVVRIESPFDGQGIVVVQGETIQRLVPITISQGVGEVKLPVAEEQYPNVWVEASVIHAVQSGRKQVYPFSSFAMANLVVRDSRKALAVSFPSLPQEVRPATPVTVALEVRDAAGQPAATEVTVAAVDEGIHNITGYKNPDPYGWLGRSRRPDFRRAHYYDKVVYDFSKPSPGGDMGNEMAKRASAVEENWIRPVALWSGAVETGDDGTAEVTFDVPEFSGQLRIVAVAASQQALGAGSANLLVRRPQMLQTSMPRFMLPGDKAMCRAVLFNNSEQAVTANVSWSVGGALTGSQGAQKVEVAPKSEASVLAEITAGDAVGQGEIRWHASVMDASGQETESLHQVALMPVRPPAAYRSVHALQAVGAGETRTFKNEAFLDDARASMELTVSASPTLRLKDALQYLVGYPYGCVEQTTSRLMPMYLLRKNQGLVKTTLSDSDTLEGYIQAGITRLFSMQTTSGGFGFWPGQNEPYPYGSVYALHFLTLVKSGREFDVPDDGFRQLQGYVRGLAMNWSGENQTESDVYLRAYATYVLALDGDMEAIRQIERFDTLSLPTAARYLLAAALAKNTGDTDRVRLYLTSTPSQPYTTREQGGTLNSDIRNTAVRLLALTQSKGKADEMQTLANELTKFLTTHRYGTTQETAFIVTALTSYLTSVTGDIAGASATIKGSGKEGVIKGDDTFDVRHDGPGGHFTVVNTGKTPVYVSLTTRGIPAKPVDEPVSEGLGVGRAFMDNRGEPYEGTTFVQGDSFVIDVTLTCSGRLENVVVADLLPAGFEVENPRLDPDVLSGGVFEEAATPSNLEIRDDRLVLAFDSLDEGTHHFYYVVRAVTPGTYQHPPLAAECMYDPSIRAVAAGGQIDVTAR